MRQCGCPFPPSEKLPLGTRWSGVSSTLGLLRVPLLLRWAIIFVHFPGPSSIEGNMVSNELYNNPQAQTTLHRNCNRPGPAARFEQNLWHNVQSCSEAMLLWLWFIWPCRRPWFPVSPAIQLSPQPALMKIQLGRRGEHYYLRRMGGSYLLEGSGRCWMSREKDLQGLCGAPAISPTIVVSPQL